MDDPVRRFYDELANDYDLLFADWRQSMERQAAALGEIIDEALGDGPLAVLDCACGIGTQAIGLTLRGYRVRATDLSFEGGGAGGARGERAGRCGELWRCRSANAGCGSRGRV